MLKTAAVALSAVACFVAWPVAQSATVTVFDHSVPTGANFDKADFRLWCPADAGALRAVVVLVPGSNGDARADVSDSTWQAFATRHKLALLGCQFTDKPHDQGFIEQYADVSKGSGQALIDALAAVAMKAKHPEIARAPLLLWGMSAGGQFNYEFVAWRPERVLGFVVNKGGIYYTALVPRASRSVPGLLFTGEKHLWSRKDIIAGIFAVNRRAGALWAFAEEPGAAHVVGRSRELTMVFFEDLLAQRLGGDAAAGAPRPLAEKDGFLGDLTTKTIRSAAAGAGTGPTAWLPTERTARAWQVIVTAQPFEK